MFPREIASFKFNPRGWETMIIGDDSSGKYWAVRDGTAVTSKDTTKRTMLSRAWWLIWKQRLIGFKDWNYKPKVAQLNETTKAGTRGN